MPHTSAFRAFPMLLLRSSTYERWETLGGSNGRSVFVSAGCRVPAEMHAPTFKPRVEPSASCSGRQPRRRCN
eukprot:6307072-Amphidinium_carterae.1